MSFYIEKMIVTGPGKTDSIIELSNGVNIIYGPSNTGKTYIVKCIDYMFGSVREPIDVSVGYEYVKLIIRTSRGVITMSRKIGENKIQVSSTDGRITSGGYATKASKKNYEKTINSVWLSLIGIDEMHLINTNEQFKKQILSWRTFCHFFVLSETKIISEYSAILSGRDTSNTAVIASLIFLLTGQDFAETETKDSKEMKEAKRNAVKTYINKELFRLSERNQELLMQLNENPNIDIELEIEEITAKIIEHEKNINQSIEGNQKILLQLQEKNENLSECNVLLNRYKELTTQYAADLKRLNFIADGEANLSEPFSTQCPFCDGEVVVNKKYNYIDAAKADYKKIQLQAKDLGKASEDLYTEKKNLVIEIDMLMAKKEDTEKLVETQLRPQLTTFKEKLLAYKVAIEHQKEMDILKRISAQKMADIIENEGEEENELKFRVKEHLAYDFIEDVTERITKFLENCKYDNLLSVAFDKSYMDIVVNGKKKSSNGKGYNAYFNTAVALILSRYMRDKAKYAPDLLVLDSPILSLKEKEGKKPSETMRNALFENIVRHQNGIQTIIIENEIPNIEYGDTNIIYFTKEVDNGRYGFLLDVVD